MNGMDFLDELLEELLRVSLWNLKRIEEAQDGSSEAMCLLMEAADNYNFIQHAYDNRRGARLHVD